MRQMKWSYQTLRSQPDEVIDILKMMQRQDAQKEREDTAKAEKKLKEAQAKSKAKGGGKGGYAGRARRR